VCPNVWTVDIGLLNIFNVTRKAAATTRHGLSVSLLQQLAGVATRRDGRTNGRTGIAVWYSSHHVMLPAGRVVSAVVDVTGTVLRRPVNGHRQTTRGVTAAVVRRGFPTPICNRNTRAPFPSQLS